MSIPIKEPKSNYTIVPAGNHVARCYQIVHIGEIPVISFKGGEKLTDVIRITFELPDELTVFKEENGEQPFSISREYTYSMYEKANLGKLIEGWLGKSFTEEETKTFDISCMLGKTCLLNVIHKISAKGKEYTLISGASPIPKEMKIGEPVNEQIIIDYDNVTEEIINSLPKFIQDKMRSSVEYRNKFDIGAQGADPISEEKTANTSFPPDNSPENPPWK